MGRPAKKKPRKCPLQEGDPDWFKYDDIRAGRPPRKRPPPCDGPKLLNWLDPPRGVRWHSAPQENISSKNPEDEVKNLKDEVEELKVLATELDELKRRLWPAALLRAEVAAVPLYDSSSSSSGEDGADGGDHLQAIAANLFDRARKSCNVHETPPGRYVSRSAFKLEHLDATASLVDTGICDAGEPFRFADLCGAPGGFTEYIASAAGGAEWEGWGLSLLGDNADGSGVPWRMDALLPYLSHGKFRVSAGADGTGDILVGENVEHLRGEITAGQGRLVHLVVADGGTDAQRDAEDQEETGRALITAQAHAALRLLRPGGSLVLKYFGAAPGGPTRGTLMRLIARFREAGVAKPVSSRPASAERYLLCRGYMPDEDKARNGEDTGGSRSLISFLNGIDRDVLSLNIKSCSDILKHLEVKQAGEDVAES